MSKLSHIDGQGRASMVDVSDKAVTTREARAEGFVRMLPKTLEMVIDGTHKKGDVLTVARIAGIQAAKQCGNLIPLCHPLALSSIEVDITPDKQAGGVYIQACCRLDGKTGVEMEALTATSVAALTIYDMCKAIDRGMVIEQIRLLEKSGGRSGYWRADSE